MQHTPFSRAAKPFGHEVVHIHLRSLPALATKKSAKLQ